MVNDIGLWPRSCGDPRSIAIKHRLAGAPSAMSPLRYAISDIGSRTVKSLALCYWSFEPDEESSMKRACVAILAACLSLLLAVPASSEKPTNEALKERVNDNVVFLMGGSRALPSTSLPTTYPWS